MKAWVLHDIGDIRLQTAEKPRPGIGEALVAVKAAGICGSDIPRIYQTGAHRMPLIPGHEFSGVVEAVGADTPTSWLGRRVGIFPLLPCKVCAPCREKRYEMCRNYNYIGSRCNGAFAEYVSVPVWNLIELPETVTYEEAAMLEPMAVAVHAMRQACLKGNGAVVICGMGTIGQLLLMFLLEAKNREILVIGNKDSQRCKAFEMGLPKDCFCDSRKEDPGNWLRERTKDMGAGVFFECVGKNEVISFAIEHTAFGGQVVLVGNPYSDLCLEKSVYWKILRNQLTVKGTWNSSFIHEKEDDWHYVIKRLSDGGIAPAGLISHRFSIEDLEKGFLIMHDKSEEYGKIMWVMM